MLFVIDLEVIANLQQSQNGEKEPSLLIKDQEDWSWLLTTMINQGHDLVITSTQPEHDEIIKNIAKVLLPKNICSRMYSLITNNLKRILLQQANEGPLYYVGEATIPTSHNIGVINPDLNDSHLDNLSNILVPEYEQNSIDFLESQDPAEVEEFLATTWILTPPCSPPATPLHRAAPLPQVAQSPLATIIEDYCTLKVTNQRLFPENNARNLYCEHLINFIFCDDYWKTQGKKGELPQAIKSLKSEIGLSNKVNHLNQEFIVELLRNLKNQANSALQQVEDLASSYLGKTIGGSITSFLGKKLSTESTKSLQRFLHELQNLDVDADPKSDYWEEKAKNLVSFIATRENLQRFYGSKKALVQVHFGADRIWKMLEASEIEDRGQNLFGYVKYDLAKKYKH